MTIYTIKIFYLFGFQNCLILLPSRGGRYFKYVKNYGKKPLFRFKMLHFG